MSVINKMLRDLDKQQEKPHNRGFVSFKPQRKSHLLVWAAVPLALLAGWCGQAWYMERFSIKTDQVVTEKQVQQGQLHPLATAAKLMPEAQRLATQLNQAQPVPEQSVGLKEIVASRISPELAAQLPTAQVTEPKAEPEPKLQPFVNQPVAEARVVQVQMVEQNEDDNRFASQAATEQVQVAEFDQSAELGAEAETPLETDWNDDLVVADKARSLAIEKVQLSPQQQKELLQQKAKKAEAAGNLQQAASHWQQIRLLEPQSPEAYLELSRLAQLQRDDATAVQILEQARAAGVQDPKLSLALAAFAWKQQDWAKALSYLQYEPDIFNYVDFYALKAAALQKTSQHAQSVQVFQQLARQQPEQARWWLGMALSYDALQQPEQALLAYRQVVSNGSGLSAASLDYVKKRITALE